MVSYVDDYFRTKIPVFKFPSGDFSTRGTYVDHIKNFHRNIQIYLHYDSDHFHSNYRRNIYYVCRNLNSSNAYRDFFPYAMNLLIFRMLRKHMFHHS